VASAAQQLLNFADLAQVGAWFFGIFAEMGDGRHKMSRRTMLSHAEAPEAMLEAESAGSLQHLDLPEQLGRCAASLWDRFVEAAQINGGVPGVGNQRLTKHEKHILKSSAICCTDPR